jgi:hypothetical protein
MEILHIKNERKKTKLALQYKPEEEELWEGQEGDGALKPEHA